MTQITIKELLKDEQYKKYFLTSPKLPDHLSNIQPWKLYVKLKDKDRWQAKRFSTYKEAAIAFKKLLPKIDDAAINCPPLGFRPPIRNIRLKGQTTIIRGQESPVYRSVVWRPTLEADHEPHYWCSYCRRPTVFRVLSVRLPTLDKASNFLSTPKLRCSICMASDELINIKHPEREQGWDPNRAPLYEIYRK